MKKIIIAITALFLLAGAVAFADWDDHNRFGLGYPPYDLTGKWVLMAKDNMPSNIALELDDDWDFKFKRSGRTFDWGYYSVNGNSINLQSPVVGVKTYTYKVTRDANRDVLTLTDGKETNTYILYEKD